jgi:ArsR family transcriptional regulator
VLTDARIVEKHREGSWVFFDLLADGELAPLVAGVLSQIGEHDPDVAVDLDRLAVVRGRRAATAQEYFSGVARRWDQERSLHAADEVVESAVLEIASRRTYASVVDLGTGTGRMLQLLVHAGVERAVGVDSSHSMLAVARANLERSGLRRVDLRQGDVYSPPLDQRSVDLVVVHQVLHYLDDPARAVREAARLLAPGGRLVIVDFAPHTLEFLRTEHAHRRLGFKSAVVAGWMTQAGLTVGQAITIAPPDDGGERLTVCVWHGSFPDMLPRRGG